MNKVLALACIAWGLLTLPAGAETLGIRPLGADYNSARTVGPGNWTLEAGVSLDSFSEPTFSSNSLGEPNNGLSDADSTILGRWQGLPVLPDIRGLYGLKDGNEIAAQIGPIVGGAYRKFFIRADAPWPHEYLQALMEFGGGFHLISRSFMGYVRFPAIFEAGPITLHVAGGGYYLLNNQPIVEADFGLEYTLFDRLQVGGTAQMRLDSTQITPTAGVLSFGVGARYQLGPRMVIQVDANQDGGPPSFAASFPHPRIEYPYSGLRATVGYYF